MAIPVVLLAASAYFLTAESPIDANRRLLALGIVWFGTIPTLIYLLDTRRPPIPFLPLLGLFYASNFGLPVLLASSDNSTNMDSTLRIADVSPDSLWLTLGAMACLFVSFYVGAQFFRRRGKALHLPGDWKAPRFKMCLWAGLGLYLIYRVNPFLKSLPTLGSFIDPFVYLCFGLFFFLQRAKCLSRTESLLLWGIILPAELLLRFASGLLTEAMIFGLFFSLICFRTLPKMALTLIVACCVSLAVVSPVKTEFRMITWYQSQAMGTSQGIFSKCTLLLDLLYDYYFGSHTIQKLELRHEDLLSSLAMRMANITLLSLVIDRTPNAVPYWGGETYLPLFTKVVPRALWPNKPIENTGNRFGHRYAILDDDDDITSLNMPWLVEMYANFGRMGTYVAMVLAGLILAAINRLFNRWEANPVEYVVGAAVLLQLIYQESSFSLTVGGALLLFIVMRIIVYLILPPARRAGGPAAPRMIR